MKEEIRKQAMVELNRGSTPREGWTVLGRSFLLAILIFAFVGWSQGLQAQEYPTRPINLLISAPPGGGTDACGRMIAQAATKILGQEFIPVNKPGGAGSVATGIVAHSKGDGYTLVAGPWPPLTSVPHLESVPYDPLKDIIPIIQFGFIYSGIIVPSDSPYNSLKELIDFSRRNPGKVSCGHSGVGTGTHLAMEYLIQQEKVNIIMVPFAAAAPAFVALLGGHVTVAVVGQGVFWPNLRAGKIKALASTADKRTKELPDTPTLLELGYPDGVFTESYIIAAPKGTPPAVVEKLEGTFRKIMKTEEYRNVADNFRIYLENPLSPQNLKDAIEKEYVKIGEVIRKTNLGK